MEAIGWQDEHLLDHRRRLRNGLSVSFAVHGLFFAMLVISPSRTVPPMPDVLSVDLIAAPSAAPQPAPPAAAPAPSAPPKVAPKPPPPPPKAAPKAAPKPPPPPPIAKAPVQALPENAPSKIRKVEPKRDVDPRRRPKEEEFSYEDAMKSIDNEMGKALSSEILQPRPAEEPVESSGSPSQKAGIQVSPQMLAWATATTRQIQSNWKAVSSYSGQGLRTTLAFEISARGDVVGTPTVARSSGDPFFDDNAVRAIMMVSPLPAPPHAGPITFVFKSEGE